jgi:hypothetical protein
MRASLLPALALLVVACSKPDTAVATTSGSASAALASASASATPAAMAPIPAELRTQLDAGVGCKWAENGLMQSCPASEALRKWVDAHKTAPTLDGCLSAVSDPKPAIRVMASSCLYQYYFATNTLDAKPTVGRLFDVVLAAIEREAEPGVRAALASALWQRSADSVGKTSAVVATLQKLDASKDGAAMWQLLASLHSYGMSEEVPKSVADLAATYATSTDRDLRREAYVVLSHAPSQGASACPLLARAVATDNDKWFEALGSLTRIGKPCEAQVASVNDALVQRLEKAADPKHTFGDEIPMWGELRGWVTSELVSTEQREAIAKASDKIARGAKTSDGDKKIARTLADEARAKKKAK